MSRTAPIVVAALLASSACTYDFGVDSLPVGCATPQTTCGGNCVDTQNDDANCGTCGTACASNSFGCSAGACSTVSTLAWAPTSTANPVTQTATAAADAGVGEVLSYDATGMQVFTEQTFTFTATAPTTTTFAFTWQYSGVHEFFMASAGLQAFANGPGSPQTVDLVPSGTTVAGGFTYSGTNALDLTAGYPFGFIASGVNFDSTMELMGTITITPN